jgi:heterodisulfide reductase subunit C
VTLTDEVTNCYQCGKCTAGCPQADRMDIAPNQVIRLIQNGQTDKALRSAAIWKCLSCFTCSSRCPQQVACAEVLDALRRLAAEKGVAAGGESRTLIFHNAFLHNIRRNGRLNEIELIGLFKTRATLADADLSFLFKDASLAPALRRKKKLHLAPGGVRDRELVRRIFQRCGA